MLFGLDLRSISIRRGYNLKSTYPNEVIRINYVHWRRRDGDDEWIVKSCFVVIYFVSNFAHVHVNHFRFFLQEKEILKIESWLD